jgi:3-deoxy-D-manno-octulosonic-acid transferase
VQALAEQLAQDWQGADRRPILLAASTHRGEDELVLQAFAKIKAVLPQAPLLVLVPRHPERFAQVAQLCQKRGYALARRSVAESTTNADILLGDTMGELMTLFGACDIAFVGGSLVPSGGHNMIEPAAWGVPVLTGPHLFNFTEASQLLLDGGAMQICNDADELAQCCLVLLQDPHRREQMGGAARLVAEANRGALGRLSSLLDRFI